MLHYSICMNFALHYCIYTWSVIASQAHTAQQAFACYSLIHIGSIVLACMRVMRGQVWCTGTAAVSSLGLPAAPTTPLPLVASLTKAVPSPMLQWQLLDILYSYCFIMRLYNGDYQSDPQVFATLIHVT